MRSIVLCALLALLCAPLAFGDVVKDISTGLDNATNSVIPGGQPDPDYTITPGDLTATVLSEAFPIPPWAANTETSKWIGFDTASSNAEPIVYDFTTTVSMEGFIPSTASVSGFWSTDNMGQDILVNDVSTGISNDGNFGALHEFAIAAGMFGPGENTITFRFENAPPNLNPAGLRVEAVVDAVPIPEPMTLTLLVLGLAGTVAFGRRNRTV